MTGSASNRPAAQDQTTSGDDGAEFDTALVFAREFYPSARFTVVGRLPATITVSMLTGAAGEPVPVLSQPDDYEGYVISLEIGTGAIYSFLFTERYLPQAGRYAFGVDVTYFSTLLNLVEVPLRRVGGG